MWPTKSSQDGGRVREVTGKTFQADSVDIAAVIRKRVDHYECVGESEGEASECATGHQQRVRFCLN